VRVIQHKNDDPNAGIAFTVRIPQKELNRVPYGMIPFGHAPNVADNKQPSTMLRQMSDLALWLERNPE
jgi:hypothetical protein